MKFLTFILPFIFLATSVSAEQGCFDPIDTSKSIESHVTDEFEYEETPSIRGDKYQFDVCFHILHSGDTGKIPESATREQIQVANSAFAGKYSRNMPDTGISFVWKSIDYTNNDAWFRRCSLSEETEAFTQQLHIPYCINVYVCNCAFAIGLATLPYKYNPFTESFRYGKEDHPMINVKLWYQVVPGHKNVNPLFNKGRIFVHELGHYLGLKHPYEGGCSGTEAYSDNITDTPRMEGNIGQGTCDTKLRSCGSRVPIHNYMLATKDSCRTVFTDGQIERMRYCIPKFKPKSGKVVGRDEL